MADGEHWLDGHVLGAYMAGFWLLGLVYITCNLPSYSRPNALREAFKKPMASLPRR